MNARAVLSGIAALAAVGVFYTFAFCMVDDVDDAQISEDYYYSTETDALTDFSETAKAAIDTVNTPSADETQSNEYNKETAPLPEEGDAVRVNLSIEQNHGYMAPPMAPPAVGNDEDASLVITPLASGEEEQGATTSVPVSAEEPETTQSAGAETVYTPEEISYDDIPEDIEGDTPLPQDSDHSASEDYLNALDYEAEESGQSIEEINRIMMEMQLSLTETQAQTVPDITDSLAGTDIFTSVPTDTLTFNDTYFETVPTFESTQTSESLVTESVTGSEMFTAKVGGTVGEYDAYQLVCMIVATEMSPSFSEEALKAQAVAAYSYVKYHNVNGLVPSVLVKSDIPAEVTEAVNAVWGKCCYYNGSVAQTLYTASSAGSTASAVNVWGGDNFPYLNSVATPFDAQSDPNYGVITTFSEDQIRTALESSLGITLSDDPANWLVVTSRVDGNYVNSVSVDGQTSVSGRKLRESILKYGIKSWCFDVSYENGEFTFVTYGYGHGVGMSQNGANILGKQGYTYDSILSYYFPGITIE